MQTPERLTEKLATALGGDLRCSVLYGSSAVEERAGRFSDFNLMLVVARADVETLRRISVPVGDWIEAGNPAPIVIPEGVIGRSNDVFPIEFSDLKDRHRVLHGDGAWIRALEVNRVHLRHQLEFELRSKLMLMRQGYVAAGGRAAAEDEVAARALSSVLALFRATLRLFGERVPSTAPDVIRALQARVPIEADAWIAVWESRQRRRPALDADARFTGAIAGLESLVNFVDAHGAS